MKPTHTLPLLLLTPILAQAQNPCDSLSAEFGASTTGLTAHFQADWASPGTAYYWSFGDGAHATTFDPAHTYAQTGPYQVCLHVAWPIPGTLDTCHAEHCEWITVAGGGSPCDSLNALFDASTTGLTAHFTNALVGTSYTYHWTFGDGSEGYGPNPSHTYANSGTYYACLIMWAWNPLTQDTCFADHCEYVTIQGGSPCDSLNAQFQWGQNGLTNNIFYSATSPYAQGWHWSYGDGASSNNGPQGDHTYPHPGTYQLCLTVWSVIPGTLDTCHADHCEWVTIAGGGSPCDSLNAQFQWGQNGLTNNIFYSATSPYAQGWHWSYGDGASSNNGPQGDHTYPHPGTYQLCLTVWSVIPGTLDTCHADHCEWITVVGGGSACDSLNAQFTTGSSGLTAHFTNALVGTSYTYHWTFGDGSDGYGPNPSHTYAGSGTYYACLIMWAWNPLTQDTCFADHCDHITVQGGGTLCDTLGQAAFGYQNVGTNGVLFGNNSTHTQGTGTSYLWSFGDGAHSDAMEATHTYAQSGTYTVCLTQFVWLLGTNDTCHTTYCHEVHVGQGSPCDTVAHADFTEQMDGHTVHFTDASYTSPGWVVHYSWEFGDGGHSDMQDPEHTYGQTQQDAIVCETVSVYNTMLGDSCHSTHCDTLVFATGIAEPGRANGPTAYPQPFDEGFTLSGPELQGTVRFTLQDMAGRVIDDRSRAVAGTITLAYTALPPGYYLLRVRGALLDRGLRVMKR